MEVELPLGRSVINGTTPSSYYNNEVLRQSGSVAAQSIFIYLLPISKKEHINIVNQCSVNNFLDTIYRQQQPLLQGLLSVCQILVFSIHICKDQFTYSYSYLGLLVNPNIFVFVITLFCQLQFIQIRICLKMGSKNICICIWQLFFN